MRKRTQRQLELAASMVLPALSMGYLVWVGMTPATLEAIPVKAKKIDAVVELPLPDKPANSVFQKRLQGPVVVENKAPQSPTVTQSVVWPAIKLECVLKGPKSALAVLICNGKTYRCQKGDRAESVVVDDILDESIVVSQNGQTKTISISKPK